MAGLKKYGKKFDGKYYILRTLGHGRHLDTHAVQVNEGGEQRRHLNVRPVHQARDEVYKTWQFQRHLGGRSDVLCLREGGFDWRRRGCWEGTRSRELLVDHDGSRRLMGNVGDHLH